MFDSDSIESQEQAVIETFNQQAPTYFDGYVGDTPEAHSFNMRRQRVYELLEGCQRGKALDIGCGPGVTVEYLLSRGYQVVGVDISERMLNECKKRFGHTDAVTFQLGKIEDLQFPDDYFDVVICMGVVEYIADDFKAVSEMSRVLKPKGKVIITMPNKLSPYRLWQRHVYDPLAKSVKKLTGRESQESIIHKEYVESSYRRLLEATRLAVTDVVYYNYKVILAPFDRLCPKLTVMTSRQLEPLCRSRLRWLGTGFIVSATKQ